MSLSFRLTAVPLVCLAAVACNGGGNDPGAAVTLPDTVAGESSPADGSIPAEDPAPTLVTDVEPRPGEVGVPTVSGASLAAPLEPPADVPPGAALRIAATSLCPTVGETFELAVEVVPPRPDDGTEPESFDVTASVALTQSFGEGLELLSQGDGAIALRMTRQNIVALRADFADAVSTGADDATAPDLSTGRTVYVGGFAAGSPPAVLMRKPVPRGCLYALRLPDRGFCGTAISRGGRGSLGTGDTVVSVDGCDHEAPEGLSIIELDADASG